MDKEYLNNRRYYGIDLLRITSMFMVVILHILGHGGVLSSLISKSANFFILSGLESICIIAVNCFALTTGFLYVGKKIKIKNILNLYLKVFLYSFGIAVIFFVINKEFFNFKDLLGFLFPIESNKYWYFSSYFILFLFMPLLNVILNNIEKKFMFVFLGGIVLFLGVYGYVLTRFFGDTFVINDGYSFVWLSILYLFGGAIKKYNIFFKLKASKWFLLYILTVILNYLCGIILSVLSLFAKPPYIGNYTFIFNILSSCLLLFFFASLNIKSSNVISFFSKYSFGVYLLHEHTFIRNAFISGKFVFLVNCNPILAILIIVCVALCIYIIGAILDFLITFLLKILRVTKLTELIDNKIVNFYNSVKIKNDIIDRHTNI